jgi:hypothetical protein
LDLSWAPSFAPLDLSAYFVLRWSLSPAILFQALKFGALLFSLMPGRRSPLALPDFRAHLSFSCVRTYFGASSTAGLAFLRLVFLSLAGAPCRSSFSLLIRLFPGPSSLRFRPLTRFAYFARALSGRCAWLSSVCVRGVFPSAVEFTAC